MKTEYYIRPNFGTAFEIPYKKMTKNKFLFTVFAIFCGFVSNPLAAQWDTGTDTAKTDTTSAGTGAGWGGDDGGWGGSGKASDKPIEYKKYERFIPPFDSLRDLIYYEGIIELSDPISPHPDTLWFRVKNYLAKRYGKDAAKSFVVEDKKPDKMTLKVSIPMMVTHGEVAKAQDGILEFKLVIRLKDGDRLKYQASNFVHIETPNGAVGKQVKTYHEFYMRIKKGYQATDIYLLAADKEIKTFGEGLKKAVQDPYNPEEEDDDF